MANAALRDRAEAPETRGRRVVRISRSAASATTICIFHDGYSAWECDRKLDVTGIPHAPFHARTRDRGLWFENGQGRTRMFVKPALGAVFTWIG